MKSLLFLTCVFVCANALDKALVDELGRKLQISGVECSESENVPDDDMAGLMQGKMPSSHEGKCLLFCVGKKLNMMHPDGTFGEGYVEWLTKVKADDPDAYTKIRTLDTDCQHKIQIDADPCETASRYYTCGKEEAPKVGLSELYSK
nr:odorant binding protein 5 [Pagiophloeus tsushimanus]